MDSLDVALHRAFGVASCIYGVKSLVEGHPQRAREARSLAPVAKVGAGLLLLFSGAGTALQSQYSAAPYFAAPAIALLALMAVLQKRASETIDLTLLAAALLYVVTT